MKVNFKLGDRVKLNKDIPSVDGMLYVGSLAKIDEIKDHSKIYPVRGNIRLIYDLGKIWWVSLNNISASFL